MVEEYNSIMVNDVWEVVPRPQDRSMVGSTWIYKNKYAADNSLEKYEARFVARETFALVARIIQTHWGLQEESSHRIRYEGFGTHYFLGLEVWQHNQEIFLGQGRYATEILKIFRMEDCRPMATQMITNWKKIDASEDKDVDPTLYTQLIGSLMYLVNTRPDIFYVVNNLSQFMVEPERAHWAPAKHVLRYLQGTVNYGLLYTKAGKADVEGRSKNCREQQELPEQLGKLTQRIEARTAGNSQNCWEQPELPGTAGTAGEADAEGKSRNCREQQELPGKLTQRTEEVTQK
eukprot:PITA_16452